MKPFKEVYWMLSIVIYGRKQKLMLKEPVMYDYIGCFYPEGGKLICKHLKLEN